MWTVDTGFKESDAAAYTALVTSLISPCLAFLEIAVVVQTRSSKSTSQWFFVLSAVGSLTGLWYALTIGNLIYIISNGGGLLTNVLTVGVIHHYREQKPR